MYMYKFMECVCVCIYIHVSAVQKFTGNVENVKYPLSCVFMFLWDVHFSLFLYTSTLLIFS